jgi:hypothetical protein
VSLCLTLGIDIYELYGIVGQPNDYILRLTDLNGSYGVGVIGENATRWDGNDRFGMSSGKALVVLAWN